MGMEWTSAGMGDTPVGTVSWFASSAAPAGWLVADGSAVSRGTYAELFAVIGTVYGAGDGSTTFNVPDLRGQFLRGWDSAGGTARNCDVGRLFGTTQASTQIWCGIDTFYGAQGFRSGGENPITGGFPDTGHASRCNAAFQARPGSYGIRPTNVAMLPCIKWIVTTAPAACGIPYSCITGKGSLITGDAVDSPVALPVGTDGKALIACSACATGLTWGDVAPVKVVQRTISSTADVTLATEISSEGMISGESITILNSNDLSSGTVVNIVATSFVNIVSYPGQATSTNFTLPAGATVSLILNDAATDTWYIESYDNPAGQAGSVAFRAATDDSFVDEGLTAGDVIYTNNGLNYRVMLFTSQSTTINPNGYYNPSNGRFTPKLPGYYSVNFRFMFRNNSSSGTSGYIAVLKNGVEYSLAFDDTASFSCPSIETVVYMNGTTDYLQVAATVSSAGTVPVLTGTAGSQEWTITLTNQAESVGINAASGFTITAGSAPNTGGGIAPVVPGTNGVAISTEFDPQGWLNSTNGRFTPTIPGYYQVDVTGTVVSGNGDLWVGFYKNGVAYGQTITPKTGDILQWSSGTYSAVVYLNGTTDYVQMGAAFKGGPMVFSTGAAGVNRINISLIGANVALPPSTIVGQSATGIVNAGCAICLDNIQVRMAPSGNRSFQFALTSGTATVGYISCPGVYFNNATTGIALANAFGCASYTANTTFTYFNSGNDYQWTNSTQQATIIVGNPITAVYDVCGVVGLSYNNNAITITRVA
jgi:hypothetical protein